MKLQLLTRKKIKFWLPLLVFFVAIISIFLIPKPNLKTYNNVLDHAKPIPADAACKTIPGVDFIYVINLDKRPQRWESCANQFKAYNITPYRFSAVNGYQLRLSDIEQLGVRLDSSMRKSPLFKRKYTGIRFYEDKNGFIQSKHEKLRTNGAVYFQVNTGGLGCNLSHLSVIKDAYDKGHETAWIMEDDIEILKDPHILSKLIKELDGLVGKDWDVLYTDLDRRNDDGSYVISIAIPKPRRPNFTPPVNYNPLYRIRIGDNFIKTNSRYGLHSYIIRRSGMKKVLDFMQENNLYAHFDQEIFIIPNMTHYCTIQDIVSNKLNSKSDSDGAWDLRTK